MTTPYIINFQNISSQTGELNIFEIQNQINFEIKRIFILNDLKSDVTRGNHAHKQTNQLLICLTGQIEVYTEMPDGKKYNFTLTNPRSGLFLPPHAWHYMKYHKNSIQMVCASLQYDEQDYLRSKSQFVDYYNK